MATIKKATKAKNLSAGPSKKTPKAGPVDSKGKWTSIQERTLGNMKKGGKIKKAQNGVDATRVAPKRNPDADDKIAESKGFFKKTSISYPSYEEMPPGRKYIPSKNPQKNKREEERIKKDVEAYELRKSKIGNIPDGKKEIPIGKKKMKSGGKISTAKGGKWIQSAIKKPGALRAQLGAKPGKPIAAGKLAAAAKKPGKLGQRARLAVTLGKMRKK